MWRICALMLAATVLTAADESPAFRAKFNAADPADFVDDVSGAPVPARTVGRLPGADGLGIACRFNYRAGIRTYVEIPATEPLKDLPRDNFSVEFWFSPTQNRHSHIVNHGQPFWMRWRQGHAIWWGVTTADGESRAVRSPFGVIDALVFPTPEWHHFVGTYSGDTASIYLDGRPVATAKFPESKPAAPIAQPIELGGVGWERYVGGLDELSVYRHAFTAAEVQARHAVATAAFQPAPAPPKAVAGTLDGAPYEKDWVSFILQHGHADISNNGVLTITSRIPRWGRDGGLGYYAIANSGGLKENYWEKLDGEVRMHHDGRANVSLRGESYRHLGVDMQLAVSREDEIVYTFKLWPATPTAPKPFVNWPWHLWPSAVPFVGHDETGRKVRGRLMDLDDTCHFTGTLEMTPVQGGCRLLARIPEGWQWTLEASREPSRWINGYTTFPGRLEPVAWQNWQGITADNPLTMSFLLQVTDDADAPQLPPDGAAEITPERPFDLRGLYEPNDTTTYLAPEGRDTPIWQSGETVEFRLHLEHSVLTQRPECRIAVTDAYSGKAVAEQVLRVDDRWWEFQGIASFVPPAPSVYLVAMRVVLPDGTVAAQVEREAAVCGVIEQPEKPVGAKLARTLVDSIDCTMDDVNHSYYSRSGHAEVVDTPAGRARETLTNPAMAKLGTNDLDWFGYRLRVPDPSRVHILEVDYPDTADRTMGITIYEGDKRSFDGKPASMSRCLGGVSTGGVYPATNEMHTFRMVFFPTTPWCAVSIANAHCGSMADGPPAAAAAIRLYQLDEPLPALPAGGPGSDRLLGIFAESGNLAMGPFGDNELRSEFWDDPTVPPERFYREHYRAVANMIRYMRYRGDTVFVYGAYRYRAAQFPSRIFPPSFEVLRGDLLGLMAHMFAPNGLKILPTMEPFEPLPLARHIRNGLHEVRQGADSVIQVSRRGNTEAALFGSVPVNPYHPRAQAEWQALAREIGERYGALPSVAGIGWLTGPLWSPALLMKGRDLPADKVDDYYFGFTYDDETMRQFAAATGVELPGKPGDPERFAQRADWILEHARDQWIAFRSRRLAEMYAGLGKAMRAAAPNTRLYVLGQHPGFLNNAVVAPPLQTWRMFGYDPRDYAGLDDLVYVLCVPDGSGLNLFEHGGMARADYDRVRPFLDDAQLYDAVNSLPRSGRFLHRQFFENQLRYDAARPWVFGRGGGSTTPNKLNHNFYPMPGGRYNLHDFAVQLAHGSPDCIVWMWCDGSVPMGNENTLREFAAFYRCLPAGRYDTVSDTDGVVVRRWQDGDRNVWYAVNTTYKPAIARVGMPGAAIDLVSGERLVGAADKIPVPLKPCALRAFRIE